MQLLFPAIEDAERILSRGKAALSPVEYSSFHKNIEEAFSLCRIPSPDTVNSLQAIASKVERALFAEPLPISFLTYEGDETYTVYLGKPVRPTPTVWGFIRFDTKTPELWTHMFAHELWHVIFWTCLPGRKEAPQFPEWVLQEAKKTGLPLVEFLCDMGAEIACDELQVASTRSLSEMAKKNKRKARQAIAVFERLCAEFSERVACKPSVGAKG